MDVVELVLAGCDVILVSSSWTVGSGLGHGGGRGDGKGHTQNALEADGLCAEGDGCGFGASSGRGKLTGYGYGYGEDKEWEPTNHSVTPEIKMHLVLEWKCSASFFSDQQTENGKKERKRKCRTKT